MIIGDDPGSHPEITPARGVAVGSGGYVVGVIEDYVTQLRLALRGGSWLGRAGMVREVRDGLDDAAAGHEAAGLDRQAAEQAAVAEFGPVSVVAAGLRDELGVAAARQTALTLAILGAAQFLLAEFLWQHQAGVAGWPEPAAAYLVLARTVDVFNVVVIVAAALVAAGLERSTRYLAPRPIVRVIGIAVIVGIVIDLIVGSVLTWFAPVPVGSWPAAQLVGGFALTWLPMTWLAVLAWRCLRLASVRRADAEDVADDGVQLAPPVTFGG